MHYCHHCERTTSGGPYFCDECGLPRHHSSARGADRRALTLMIFASAIAVAVISSRTTARAAHCPHGQLYRVRLDECVALGSALALAYEPHSRTAGQQRRRIVLTLPPPPLSPQFRVDPTPENPAIEALREQLRDPNKPRQPGPTDLLLSRAAAIVWQP